MKILFVSKEGDSAGLWWTCKEQGATVSAFIKEKWARRIMDGIIPKVETLEEGLSAKPDVIVFDLNGMGKEADKLRKVGHKVVCGSELADKLEFDRAWGVKICQQYGVKTPKTTEFSNYDEAIAHVKKTNKPYAIKIDSNTGGESASYVGKDTQDMLDYLEHSKEDGSVKGATFILQEVVKGAELSTELWLSNGDPVWPCNSTFETKKFQAGELGQRTGCESSLVFHYGKESKVYDKTIRKILPLLKHSQWTGCIDVNCIVSEEDREPYFLEWTPRIGYSAIYAFVACLGITLPEFFYKVSRGTFTIPFKSLWGASLKISIPPYPVHIEDEKASEEVYGATEGIRVHGKIGKDFIPIDVMREDGKPGLVCAGVTAIIGECLGRGETMLEAWRASQKIFKTVEVPNAQGRYTDGAEDAWKRVLKLRQMGYMDIPRPSQSSAGPGESSSTPSIVARAR